MVGKDVDSGEDSLSKLSVLTTKDSLRPWEQRLLELAHRVGYGSLHDLKVCDGKLVCESVRIRRRVRLGRTESGRCARPLSHNFVLKAQHLECLDRIRKIKKGVVTLEIQDGLPIDLVIEENVQA